MAETHGNFICFLYIIFMRDFGSYILKNQLEKYPLLF